MSYRNRYFGRVLFVLFAISISMAVRAAENRPQAGRGAGEAAVVRFQKAKEAVLEIATDQQKAKVEEIFKNASEKLEAIRQELEKNAGQRQQVAQKLTEAMQAARTQLEQLFTPEQREKLQAKLQEILPMMGRQAQGLMGQGQILQRLREHMAELGLSDEQKQKLQSLQAELREKMQALRQELQADRQAAMPKMRQFMQEMQQKIKEILTPDQWDKLREKMAAEGSLPPGAADAKPMTGDGAKAEEKK